jgi:phosphatidate phosphatase APP1
LASSVRRGIYRVESWLDRNFYRARRRFGWYGPLSIHAYRGFGTNEKLTVQGRVLSGVDTRVCRVDDRWWRNCWAAFRAVASDEAPGAEVQASFGDSIAKGVSDEEGYFHLELPANGAHGWLDIRLDLLSPAPARALGRVFVPPPGTQFGVISDLDDTVIVTHVPRPLKALRLMLFQNALSRQAFEGAAELYRALAAGSDGRAANPIFYVSSGSWNFYDLIEQFLDHNGFPQGPILLRDIGLEPNHLFAEGNEHKLAKVDRILQSFPALPFVLIGDTGQDDPFLYAEAIRRHPGRIRAIYLRDVSEAKRSAVMELAAQVNAQGLIMRMFTSSREAMAWARTAGWIA